MCFILLSLLFHQAVINCGVIHKLVLALDSDAMQILVPALRAIGNLASGSAQQTQVNGHIVFVIA